jgi:hypothetical protein
MGIKIGKALHPTDSPWSWAAPPDKWDVIAALVKELDPLKRPVINNKRFTIKNADKYFQDDQQSK